MQGTFRFSFGPWNIHEGADPFGPPVRPTVPFAEKLKVYKKLGFEGVQFHDDDVVPNLNSMSSSEIKNTAKDVCSLLDGEGLVAEFVGLDVKAIRTQKADQATQHLANSREIFLTLLNVVRKLDTARLNVLIAERNYELLEMEIIRALLGKQ